MKKLLSCIAVIVLCTSFSLPAMEREKKPKSCWCLCNWVKSKYQNYINGKLLEAACKFDTYRMAWWIALGADVNAQMPYTWSGEELYLTFPTVVECKVRIDTSRRTHWYIYKIKPGCTPLSIVGTIKNKNNELKKAALELLFKYGAKDSCDGAEDWPECKHPALYNAIFYSDASLVKQLIENKAIDLPIEPYYLVEALENIYKEQGEIVFELLLDKVELKKINQRGRSGNTVLHDAPKKPELIQFFLENGADVSAQNVRYQETPLHLAAEHNEPKTIQSLLLYGADVTAQDGFGFTPFHHVVEYGTLCQHSQPSDIQELFVAVHGTQGLVGKKRIDENVKVLFCFLKRKTIDVPKDVRKLMYSYIINAEAQDLAARHINKLHQALALVDKEKKTAKQCFEKRRNTTNDQMYQIGSWFDPDPEKLRERFGPEICERYERVLKGLPQVEPVKDCSD